MEAGVDFGVFSLLGGVAYGRGGIGDEEGFDEGVGHDEAASLRHAPQRVFALVSDFGHDVRRPAPRTIRVLAVQREGAEGRVVVEADGADEGLDGFGGFERFGEGVGGDG